MTIRPAPPFGALLVDKQATWAVDQELRLQRFGSLAVLFPIGNPLHEASDLSTVIGMGALTQWGTAPVGTYASGARTTWENPLTHVGPGFIPMLGPFDGSTEWIQFPDDVIWNDDIAGGAHEPDYSWVMWLNLVAGASVQTLWSKTSASGITGTDWNVDISAAEKLRVRIYDDNIDKYIGQLQDSAMSAGLRHLAITKTGGSNASSSILLYVDGSLVASTANEVTAYVQQEDGSEVVRIGARTGGGNPLTSSIAGATCAPLWVPGLAVSADIIQADFQSTRVLLGV